MSKNLIKLARDLIGLSNWSFQPFGQYFQLTLQKVAVLWSILTNDLKTLKIWEFEYSSWMMWRRWCLLRSNLNHIWRRKFLLTKGFRQLWEDWKAFFLSTKEVHPLVTCRSLKFQSWLTVGLSTFFDTNFWLRILHVLPFYCVFADSSRCDQIYMNRPFWFKSSVGSTGTACSIFPLLVPRSWRFMA